MVSKNRLGSPEVITTQFPISHLYSTPSGRYRFYRVLYGLLNSPEVFQKTINSIFSNLEDVLINIDDILVFGRIIEEHD